VYQKWKLLTSAKIHSFSLEERKMTNQGGSTSEASLETLSPGICSGKGWLTAHQISFFPGLLPPSHRKNNPKNCFLEGPLGVVLSNI